MKRLIFLLLFSACGWPISPEKFPEVIQALSNDTASACIWTGIRGGAGGAAIISPAPLSGGYGSGEILMGRVNSPDTKVAIVNGSCTIERGPGTAQANPAARSTIP